MRDDAGVSAGNLVPANLSLRSRAHWVWLGAALLCYAALVARFWFVIDDAFITFRYSRNLANGLGIRYNPDESPPVEGYSNFLWMLLCAGFETLRLDPAFFAPLLGALCGAALIVLLHRRLATLDLPPLVQVLATFFLALFPPMALWGSTGMETMAFALAVFAIADSLILRPDKPHAGQAIAGGIAMCLVRTEGPAWVAVIFLLAGLSRILDGRWREARNQLLVAFAAILATFAAYFGWRYSYFGTLVANTAAAKSAILSLRWARGANYVLAFFTTFVAVVPVLVGGGICGLFGARRGMWLAVAALGFAFPMYAVVVTGDFMPMGRFLLPAAPFWALLSARLLGAIQRAAKPNGPILGFRASATVLLGTTILAAHLAPAWNIHLAPRSLLEQLRFRFNTPVFMTEYEVWQDQKDNAAEWTALGHALRRYCEQVLPRPKKPSVVMGAIGAAGYYSNLHIFDRHGLVTPEVAHRAIAADEPLVSAGHDRRVPPEFFLKDQPTILRYRQLMDARPDTVLVAAQRMAGELESGRGRMPELENYAADFYCFRDGGAERGGDFLLTWLWVGADRADRARAAFEQKLRGLSAR